MLVSGVALMAGALASSGAQAQCSDPNMSYFPFGAGSGVNALTSVISTVNTAFLNNGSAFVAAPVAEPDQLGGGVWVRAIGGTADTKASSSFSGDIQLPQWQGGAVVAADASCRTKVRQDFKGLQAGHDIALLNSDNTGMNWHFGGLAGYVQSDFSDLSPGGTLKGTFNVPFAGLYSTFSKGNFFADVQARLDYFEGELTDQANGIHKERLGAHGYAVSGNMGYRFNLGGNWNLEPSVGGVFSRTWIEPLNIAGTNLPIPGNLPPGQSLPGMVQMQNVESALGRASIKVGTSAPLGNSGIVAYPFASASVFREFAGNATATVSPGMTAGSINGNLSVGRVGTYALFSAGSAFLLADTGWLGYARFDYRTGSNIEGYGVTGGLRYQLNQGPSGLKDGSAGGHSWTGPYVGVFGGSTSGKMSNWENFSFAVNPDNAGYLAGGQLGYNLQIGNFVWGAEADYGQSNARGVDSCGFNPLETCESNVKSLGSVTGRLGYSFGRVLLYGKGGWAFGEVSAGVHLNNPNYAIGIPGTLMTSSKWNNGWTAGGGMEIALTEAWSAKAEYMHYEFQDNTYTLSYVPGVGESTRKMNASGDSVKIGVNYHLDVPGAEGAGTDAPLK